MLSRLQELRKEEETLLRVKAALHDQLTRLKVRRAGPGTRHGRREGADEHRALRAAGSAGLAYRGLAESLRGAGAAPARLSLQCLWGLMHAVPVGCARGLCPGGCRPPCCRVRPLRGGLRAVTVPRAGSSAELQLCLGVLLVLW